MTQAKKSLSKRTIAICAIVVVLIAAAVVFAVVRSNSNADKTAQPAVNTETTDVTETNEGTETAAVAESNSTPTALDEIKSKNKIVVAMEGTWLPWTYHDAQTRELTGFDVEVSKAIAAKLGVEVEFQECPWDSIFAGIEAGRYDIAVNGIDWTEERSKNLTLTNPYVYNYPVLIIREDNDEIKSFADLNNKKTANTVSSTYAALAQSYGATNLPVDDLNTTFQLLIDKRIDATINSADTFAAYKDENPNAPIMIVAQADTANSVVIAMKAGSKTETLAEAINKAIDELMQDGTLAQLSIKYFGADMTVLPSTNESGDTTAEAAE